MPVPLFEYCGKDILSKEDCQRLVEKGYLFQTPDAASLVCKRLHSAYRASSEYAAIQSRTKGKDSWFDRIIKKPLMAYRRWRNRRFFFKMIYAFAQNESTAKEAQVYAGKVLHYVNACEERPEFYAR